MTRYPSPFDLWVVGMKTAQMMIEAQTVIALRTMGMLGTWSVTPSEQTRMVSEKAPAIVDAMTKASRAAFAGKRPDQIYAAALAPIGRRTRSNARRLGKRGPKMR